MGFHMVSGMKFVKRPTAIDQCLAWRLREQRQLAGLSQTKLSEQLGITFQQIQKYEKGSNRISASRLQQIANILQVPVGYFFEQASTGHAATQEPSKGEATADVAELLATNEGLRLARAFFKSDNADTRQRIVAVVEAMANGDVDGSRGEVCHPAGAESTA